MQISGRFRDIHDCEKINAARKKGTTGYNFEDFRDICLNAHIVGITMCMLKDDLPLEGNRATRSYRLYLYTDLLSSEPWRDGGVNRMLLHYKDNGNDFYLLTDSVAYMCDSIRPPTVVNRK